MANEMAKILNGVEKIKTLLCCQGDAETAVVWAYSRVNSLVQYEAGKGKLSQRIYQQYLDKLEEYLSDVAEEVSIELILMQEPRRAGERVYPVASLRDLHAALTLSNRLVEMAKAMFESSDMDE